ncbi:hypothetical protein M7I_7591 [Glarea lozoyensis 74030]|uniref:Uncharacterized protein n=1 Tax=Glarea lozoyensis (strain ATCC 74030 / MF5533) TaxID=1104152 RepID=H0EXQ2_GLAL7|nr:hypothetical protein M7I_7591 [Glarea lozoyensis 74030]
MFLLSLTGKVIGDWAAKSLFDCEFYSSQQRKRA